MSGEYACHQSEQGCQAIRYLYLKEGSISTPTKSEAELNRMEQAGVISRVDVPIKWSTGMVGIPKTDGPIRICVDLTRLNSSVQ